MIDSLCQLSPKRGHVPLIILGKGARHGVKRASEDSRRGCPAVIKQRINTASSCARNDARLRTPNVLQAVAKAIGLSDSHANCGL